MAFLISRIEGAELPGQPLVEISGQKRVLIEHHQGVRGYSREKIMVSVSYGCVIVQGTGLYLMRMTKEQLVICGCIHSVCLQGREEA